MILLISLPCLALDITVIVFVKVPNRFVFYFICNSPEALGKIGIFE